MYGRVAGFAITILERFPFDGDSNALQPLVLDLFFTPNRKLFG